MTGNFATQLSGDKCFSRCEKDNVMEMTINKGSKISRGKTAF